jgi:hypothetical protein
MTSTHPHYEKDLAKLRALIRRRPMTARKIAKALRCCLPTAYQRLRALERRGEAVFSQPADGREKRTGPRALEYGIRTEVSLSSSAASPGSPSSSRRGRRGTSPAGRPSPGAS